MIKWDEKMECAWKKELITLTKFDVMTPARDLWNRNYLPEVDYGCEDV